MHNFIRMLVTWVTGANSFLNGQSLVSMQMFYDALTPLLGVFNEFLVIPAVETDVFTCSFLLLVQASASNSTINTRSA